MPPNMEYKSVINDKATRTTPEHDGNTAKHGSRHHAPDIEVDPFSDVLPQETKPVSQTPLSTHSAMCINCFAGVTAYAVKHLYALSPNALTVSRTQLSARIHCGFDGPAHTVRCSCRHYSY
jgi:hypothetical protein